MTYANSDPKPKRVILTKQGRRALKVRLYNGRAKECCETCGRWVSLNLPGSCFDVFFHCHLSHIIPRPRGGDGEDNVKIECYNCHFLGEDGHLKWRSDKTHKD